ncbi:hypothetical protein BJX64DRAFT_266799 [Aspergillus heterothallicus]
MSSQEWVTIPGASTVITLENEGAVTVSAQTISPVPANNDISETVFYVRSNGETALEVFYTWNSVLQTATPTTVTPTPSSTSSTETSAEDTTVTPTTSGRPASTSGTATPEATASRNETSTQTPGLHSANSSSDGFSTGTLAGAIVGSIIGSALLTLLLAFLFFRRRRASPKGGAKHVEEDVTFGGVITDKSAGFTLAAIIPQPADDETVRRRILTLIDHAGLHVDNYYTSGQSPNLSQDAITRLNFYDSGYLPAAAATMLGERQAQRHVITHLLVYRLLQAIQPGSELLPPLLAAQPQIRNSSATTDNALFAWRMLSAHLYREGRYNRDPTQTAALTQAAQDVAVGFTSAFTPFALSSFSETDRVTHFKDLAAAATELGSWLFAQPCTFEFAWTKSQTELTLVPRVLKTHDEQGNRLATPQVVIQGDTARIP